VFKVRGLHASYRIDISTPVFNWIPKVSYKRYQSLCNLLW